MVSRLSTTAYRLLTSKGYIALSSMLVITAVFTAVVTIGEK
jgi:hypothetical protein